MFPLQLLLPSHCRVLLLPFFGESPFRVRWSLSPPEGLPLSVQFPWISPSFRVLLNTVLYCIYINNNFNLLNAKQYTLIIAALVFSQDSMSRGRCHGSLGKHCAKAWNSWRTWMNGVNSLGIYIGDKLSDAPLTQNSSGWQ